MAFPLIPVALFGGLIWLAIGAVSGGNSPAPLPPKPDPVPPPPEPKPLPALPSSDDSAATKAAKAKATADYLAAIAKARASGLEHGRADGYNDTISGAFPNPDGSMSKWVDPSWGSDYKNAFIDGYRTGYSAGNAEAVSDAAKASPPDDSGSSDSSDE